MRSSGGCRPTRRRWLGRLRCGWGWHWTHRRIRCRGRRWWWGDVAVPLGTREGADSIHGVGRLRRGSRRPAWEPLPHGLPWRVVHGRVRWLRRRLWAILGIGGPAGHAEGDHRSADRRRNRRERNRDRVRGDRPLPPLGLGRRRSSGVRGCRPTEAGRRPASGRGINDRHPPRFGGLWRPALRWLSHRQGVTARGSHTDRRPTPLGVLLPLVTLALTLFDRPAEDLRDRARIDGARPRLRGKQRRDKLIDLRFDAQLRRDLTNTRRGFGELAADELHDIARVKGHAAHQHLEQHHAEGIQIGPRVHGLSLRLLRRHVLRCAKHRAWPRVSAPSDPRHAEVQQLDPRCLSLR